MNNPSRVGHSAAPGIVWVRIKLDHCTPVQPAPHPTHERTTHAPTQAQMHSAYASKGPQPTISTA